MDSDSYLNLAKSIEQLFLMNNDTQVGFSFFVFTTLLPEFNAQRTRNPPRSPIIPSFSSACAFQKKIDWEMPGKFQCASEASHLQMRGMPDFRIFQCLLPDGMLLQCSLTWTAYRWEKGLFSFFTEAENGWWFLGFGSKMLVPKGNTDAFFVTERA